MSDPSKNANLLNALVEMQESPAYAVRKTTLLNAEHCIVSQERELAAARQRITSLEAINNELQGGIIAITEERDALTARLEAAEKDGAKFKTGFYLMLASAWRVGFFGNSETDADYIRIKAAITNWNAPNNVTVSEAIDAAILAQGSAK